MDNLELVRWEVKERAASQRRWAKESRLAANVADSRPTDNGPPSAHFAAARCCWRPSLADRPVATVVAHCVGGDLFKPG
jgi:hypothetical protein